jgi:hypothetical protein
MNTKYRHWADNLKKIDCDSKHFVKHITARIKNFVWHLTGNKPAKMYTNCRQFSLFLWHKCLLLKCKKKSEKAWKFPANCQKRTKMFVQTQNRQLVYRGCLQSEIFYMFLISITGSHKRLTNNPSFSETHYNPHKIQPYGCWTGWQQ